MARKDSAAILSAVGSLPLKDTTQIPKQLSVGVGVATGEAFVGNIRAADRLIWSAIGNTTNRAARLQGLTRELGVAMVVDEATREAASAAGFDFEKRERVPISGISEPLDLYVLPLGVR